MDRKHKHAEIQRDVKEKKGIDHERHGDSSDLVDYSGRHRKVTERKHGGSADFVDYSGRHGKVMERMDRKHSIADHLHNKDARKDVIDTKIKTDSKHTIVARRHSDSKEVTDRKAKDKQESQSKTNPETWQFSVTPKADETKSQESEYAGDAESHSLQQTEDGRDHSSESNEDSENRLGRYSSAVDEIDRRIFGENEAGIVNSKFGPIRTDEKGFYAGAKDSKDRKSLLQHGYPASGGDTDQSSEPDTNKSTAKTIKEVGENLSSTVEEQLASFTKDSEGAEAELASLTRDDEEAEEVRNITKEEKAEARKRLASLTGNDEEALASFRKDDDEAEEDDEEAEQFRSTVVDEVADEQGNASGRSFTEESEHSNKSTQESVTEEPTEEEHAEKEEEATPSTASTAAEADVSSTEAPEKSTTTESTHSESSNESATEKPTTTEEPSTTEEPANSLANLRGVSAVAIVLAIFMQAKLISMA